MGEIVKIDSANNIDLTEMADAILAEARNEDIPKEKSLALPFVELTTLGAGVSSLLPVFNTVNFTSSANMEGLYRVANRCAGDTLKMAKNGNFWGAMKTASGKSKFAQLAAADSIAFDNQIVMNANPAMMLMALALFSIEKELGKIEEMEKQIIQFLEAEKASEIEGDVKSVCKIIADYKYNWDNERFIATYHNQAASIQRTARRNMLFYQKGIAEALKAKILLKAGKKVDAELKKMLKMFNYYRLSLYTFSLASFETVLLSGNFSEDNIKNIIAEMQNYSEEYRNLFGECSMHLEKLSKGIIEVGVLKGIGKTSNAVGKLIGSIPVVKEGPVDEFLIDKGNKIVESAQDIGNDVIGAFAKVSNPATGNIVSKLEDMNKIYNHTAEICFDSEALYLVGEGA